MLFVQLAAAVAILVATANACKDKWIPVQGSTRCRRSTYYEESVKPDTNINCLPGPYVPGGAEVVIESFDAPQAELQHNAVANIAKWVGFACDVTSDLTDIAGLAEEAVTNCQKLASHLGIWGTVFGFLAGQKTPTPDEIIDSVNRALAELTREVNDQFINMKGYVDQKLLQVANDRWLDDYQHHYNFFVGCLKYDPQGEETVNACMQIVESDSGSNKDTFMDFKSQINDVSWIPSVDDVKHMEVQFKVYNNYVHLRMLILMTLYGQFKDKTDAADRSMAKTYLKYLQGETELFQKYNQMCHDKIIHAYESYSQSDWAHTMECHNRYDWCEGGKNTAVKFVCSSVLDRMSKLDSQTCDYTPKIRCDGKCISSSAWILEYDLEDCSKMNYARHFYADIVRPFYNRYHRNMTRQVKNYWEPSALKSQETLQQIHDAATTALKTYQDVTEDYRGEFHSQAYHKFSAELKAARKEQMRLLKNVMPDIKGEKVEL